MIPPGLTEGDLTEVSSGGSSESWMAFSEKKFYTNAIIVKNDQILLGFKKRGFGKDMYNGFGGKVDPGETSAEAAARELHEEAGITAQLDHCGTLLFFSQNAERAFHIDIYRAEDYSGQVTETEEMRPEWFALPLDYRTLKDRLPTSPPIPFDKMWEDDDIWLPLLLSKKRFAGRVDFREEGDVYKMQKWWFGTYAVDSTTAP